MDYTYDVEMALDSHPEQANDMIQNMTEGTSDEAFRVLNDEIADFHHKLSQVIQNSRELTDFQKTLADSILGYVQDNEYEEREMRNLADGLLTENYPDGLDL